MTTQRNAPAAGGNQREGEIAIHPIPEENPNMDIIADAADDRTGWLPLWLLRQQIGPKMRDALVRSIVALERQVSGRVLIDEVETRDGTTAAIVHPELADAVRSWYRDQDVLLSNYTPSVAASRDGAAVGEMADADARWFSEHPEVLGARPAWAASVEVSDFDGLDGVEVYFERQMGPVNLTRYATYADGVLRWDDGTAAPYVSLETRYRDGLDRDDVLDLVGALLAVAPMLEAADELVLRQAVQS